MGIDRIIYAKRSLESSIKKNHDKESIDLLKELMRNYYENLDVCEHENYCHNGYYKLHNGEIYVTDKERAEYRSLICPICQKTISVLKTENPNWDNEIIGKKINIVEPFQFNHKKINMNILSLGIMNTIDEYYNEGQDYCGHLEFVNNGYYTFRRTLEKSTRGRSDFRIVTCTCCNKSYYLPKKENEYWDVSIKDNPISVYDAEDEKSKQYLITM